MKKKYKVTFLLDKSNLWIEKYLKNSKIEQNKKYNFKISKNFKKIKNQDLVFPLSYTKILPKDFLIKNKKTIIAHCSKLPKNAGFAPLQYEILKNKSKFYISLIKGIEKVDAGQIYLQHSFKLNGTELINEIRAKQAYQIIKIIKKFLKKYPNISSKKQLGKGSFNRRRNINDSELDINKTIKEQFNHLRINDNNLYPSFFKFKKKKYILKIYKK